MESARGVSEAKMKGNRALSNQNNNRRGGSPEAQKTEECEQMGQKGKGEGGGKSGQMKNERSNAPMPAHKGFDGRGARCRSEEWTAELSQMAARRQRRRRVATVAVDRVGGGAAAVVREVDGRRSRGSEG